MRKKNLYKVSRLIKMFKQKWLQVQLPILTLKFLGRNSKAIKCPIPICAQKLLGHSLGNFESRSHCWSRSHLHNDTEALLAQFSGALKQG